MQLELYGDPLIHVDVTIAGYQHLSDMQNFTEAFATQGVLIFDAVYGSWILSLPLFTLGIMHGCIDLLPFYPY